MASVLQDRRNVLHVVTDGPDSVPEVLTRFATEGVDVLVVNGGDGTLQQVLTVMLNNPIFAKLPMVAALRGGRTNMSAIDFGCQRDSAKALASLIDAARSGTLADRRVDRAVLRMDLGPEDGIQFGMFFGLGVIYRAVDLIHRSFPPTKRSRGTVGATVLTAILVARAAFLSSSGIVTPDPVGIQLENEQIRDREFLLVIASSLGHLFAGMKPFWGQEPAPVRFTALASEAKSKWRSAIGILRGQPRAHVTPESGYNSRNVNRAELRFDSGVCIDGETYPPRPDRLVRIEADRRIQFLRA